MGWLDFLTGGAGSLVEKVGNAIDQNVTSDEERLKLRNELSKAQQDFTVKAMEFQAQQDAITQKDRESARSREVELAKTGSQNHTMTALVILGFAGTAWVIWFLLNRDIREREIAFMILGFVIAIIKDIYGFYFGSSRGSQIKDEVIRNRVL